MIKPDAINSDRKGNVYIGEGANNRILKINSLTGDIVSILLLEEERKDPMHSLFWSDTQPNLTVVHADTVRTYNFLTPD